MVCILLVGGEPLPRWKSLGILFKNEGRMEIETEGQMAIAVMQSLYQSVVVKKGETKQNLDMNSGSD